MWMAFAISPIHRGNSTEVQSMYGHDEWLERYPCDIAEIRGKMIYSEHKPLVIDADGWGSGYSRYYIWDAVEPDTIYCHVMGVDAHPLYGEVDYDNFYVFISEMH